ncbi:branched-chain amino acid aminotransferase [Kiloniella laminariae]|uniref:Probable branched-chain-amino-acid aminotransferase n=1 Tax=Kiloniella laminariae TaxID=454162 RepID=A0ABT4LET0_9PROT|nr:branched-chain amino acid aminotransferase [Kiloniella laminariae]MCZ4279610.1 branched-chain amino acid aminotransferase [Kiloniella laminariae]
MAIGEVIWTYFKGEWHQGNLPIMGAADHGTWLGSLVFDGARAFEGVVPDLDLHSARVNASAEVMGLKPTMTTQQLIDLTLEGLKKFAPDAAVYIRPMYWSTEGGAGTVVPDANSTAFCLCLEQFPMAPATYSQTLCRTQFIRPMVSMAPVNAKAACLYPNNGRMIREAQARGYNNALVADALGNVAETGTSNIFMVKDDIIYTPVPNGTFLNGITRQRVIKLLREAGREVRETTLSFEDFLGADEVFMSGNISKITPVVKFEERDYPIGPVAKLARELYWIWAKA